MARHDFILHKENAEGDFESVRLNLVGSADAFLYSDANGDIKQDSKVLWNDTNLTMNKELVLNDTLTLVNLGIANGGSHLMVENNTVKSLTLASPITDINPFGTASDGEARAKINEILSVLRTQKLISV